MCVHTLCSVTGEVDTTRINCMESEKERMETQDELCKMFQTFYFTLKSMGRIIQSNGTITVIKYFKRRVNDRNYFSFKQMI